MNQQRISGWLFFRLPVWIVLFTIIGFSQRPCGAQTAYQESLDRLHRAEMPVIKKVQSQPGLAPLMRFVSNAGLGKLNGVVLTAIFFFVSPRLAIRISLFYAFGLAAREILALAFHSPRPWWIDPEMMHLGDTSLKRPTFSLPSGHAMMSSAFWLLIASEFRRRWVLPITITFILLVGYSRLYLGAHWVSDVLLGFALGSGYVVLYRRFVERLAGWWNTAPAGMKALLSAACSFGILLAGYLAALSAAGPFPPAWANIAMRARSLVAIAGYAGMLCGAGWGLALAKPVEFRDHWRLRTAALAGAGALVCGIYFLVPPIRTLDWPETQKIAAEFALRVMEGFIAFSFTPWLSAGVQSFLHGRKPNGLAGRA